MELNLNMMGANDLQQVEKLGIHKALEVYFGNSYSSIGGQENVSPVVPLVFRNNSAC